jgi:hypothetical protein
MKPSKVVLVKLDGVLLTREAREVDEDEANRKKEEGGYAVFKNWGAYKKRLHSQAMQEARAEIELERRELEIQGFFDNG